MNIVVNIYRFKCCNSTEVNMGEGRGYCSVGTSEVKTSYLKIYPSPMVGINEYGFKGVTSYK